MIWSKKGNANGLTGGKIISSHSLPLTFNHLMSANSHSAGWSHGLPWSAWITKAWNSPGSSVCWCCPPSPSTGAGGACCPPATTAYRYTLGFKHVYYACRLCSVLPGKWRHTPVPSNRFLLYSRQEVDLWQITLLVSNFPLLYISKCLWYATIPDMFRLHAYFKIFCLLYDLHRSLTSHLALVTLFIQSQYTLKSVPLDNINILDLNPSHGLTIAPAQMCT